MKVFSRVKDSSYLVYILVILVLGLVVGLFKGTLKGISEELQ